MAANEKNMSEEEYFEWMAQMDEEYNQRLEEAAKAAAQESQQETQAEVKQPQQTQQTQETQEQGNDPGVVYNDDGSITLHTAAGIDVVIGGGEGSVGELSDLAKEATVN